MYYKSIKYYNNNHLRIHLVVVIQGQISIVVDKDKVHKDILHQFKGQQIIQHINNHHLKVSDTLDSLIQVGDPKEAGQWLNTIMEMLAAVEIEEVIHQILMIQE